MKAAFMVASIGMAVSACGSSPPPSPSPSPGPSSPPASTEAVTPTASASVAAAPPAGPPFSIAKVAVSTKKLAEGMALAVSWEVTTVGPVTKGTVLFVHSSCKVGHTTKFEDETVQGVDAIGTGYAKSMSVPAFASVGLKYEPSFCTISFGYGPKKAATETKLTSFCWKKGAITDGACPAP